MGVGKSTIGPAVAAALGLPFQDLDRLVVDAACGRSIPELFERGGEAGFRALEAAALEAACLAPPHVLALGGGTLHQPGAVDRARAAFVVVVLELPWRELAPRLAGGEGRPLAADAARLFEERAPGYAAAGLSVDARGPVEEVATRVVEAWRRACGSM